jgi:hypothetical protein
MKMSSLISYQHGGVEGVTKKEKKDISLVT